MTRRLCDAATRGGARPTDAPERRTHVNKNANSAARAVPKSFSIADVATQRPSHG
jgi:hypothetical protein